MNESGELAKSINTVVTRLGRRIRRIDDRQDIGRARLSALSVLVFGGARTMGELASEEMVSAATMHHVVGGLTELKLARKQQDKKDGRKSIVTATRAGEKFMEEAREARLDFYREHLDKLDPDERAAVAEFARLAADWIR